MCVCVCVCVCVCERTYLGKLFCIKRSNFLNRVKLV